MPLRNTWCWYLLGINLNQIQIIINHHAFIIGHDLHTVGALHMYRIVLYRIVLYCIVAFVVLLCCQQLNKLPLSS